VLVGHHRQVVIEPHTRQLGNKKRPERGKLQVPAAASNRS
jgi:hypothetical protein